MKYSLSQSLQIAALYIGTIVGAGFSTGQEIIQFFSRYGILALYAILFATFLFIWLGYKIMVLSATLQANSFEDLNIALFGNKIGKTISWFLFFVLIGVCSVMLAGAGAVFEENWNIPKQIGLLITVIATFLIVRRGLNAVFAINNIVVPIMLIFTIVLAFDAFTSPQIYFYIPRETLDQPIWRGLVTPFIYVAFNLALAQAVLVPIGAKIQHRKTLKCGALIAGVGIGFMIFIAHLTISTHYPEIKHLAIPMGGIAATIGGLIYKLYILIIYAEIFTTLVADIYGVTLQSKQYIKVPTTVLYGITLFICFFIAQFGFEQLIGYVYQIFGFISLGWLALLI
jgi:uncharacterized membrane protein YkvI